MTDKNLRERIVTNAYEMFASRGVKSVTMDAISAELSISKRTLYEEFSSKHELLECVLYAMNKFYQNRNDTILGMELSAVEKIFMITSIQNERSSKEALFFQDIVFNYSQLLEKLVKDNYDVNLKRIMKNIEQGCDEGYFYTNLNYNIVLDYFFSLRKNLNYRKDISRVDIGQQHVFGTVYFLRCIATAKGVEEIDRLCKINNINIYNS